MNFLKTVVQVLAMAALLFAPLVGDDPCADDHSSSAATACFCACHAAAVDADAPPSVAIDRSATRLPLTDAIPVSRISADDIERPPAFA